MSLAPARCGYNFNNCKSHIKDLHVYLHDDVIKWKHFPRYWPFVRGIHRSPVNSPHKCQWCGVLMFSLICTWINGCINNGEAGDLRRHRAHYDVTVMLSISKPLLESMKTSIYVAIWHHWATVGQRKPNIWNWTFWSLVDIITVEKFISN